MLIAFIAIWRKTREIEKIIIHMKETFVCHYLIPILAFVLGSSIITGVYFGILTWAQGWESALQIFLPNRTYVIPTWISLGAQAMNILSVLVILVVLYHEYQKVKPASSLQTSLKTK